MVPTGSRVGHYTVGELLGRGSSGEVYAGWDELLERPIALKFLRPERRETDPELRQRALLREARLLCRLDHPNVRRVHDLLEDSGRDVLVLELIDGRLLEVEIEQRDRSARLELGRQIASALAAAHQSGVVHRDLKPENVLVTGAGVVKVLDFGLAALIETEFAATAGTLEFMSPEQARGDAVGAASDLFALGVLLHVLLTGAAPFAPQPTFPARLAALREGRTVLDPELGAATRRLLARLLALEPAARGTAREAERELLHLLDEVPRRRRHWATGLAAVAGLAVLLWAGAETARRAASSERHERSTARLVLAPIEPLAGADGPGGARATNELLPHFREALAQRLGRVPGVSVVDAAAGHPEAWTVRLAAQQVSTSRAQVTARIESVGPQRRLVAIAPDLPTAFVEIGDWLEGLLGGSPPADGSAAGLRDPFTIRLFALARHEERVHGFTAARPFYETLATLAPDLALPRIQIANALWQEGRVGEADEIWRQLLELDLSDEERADVLFNLAYDAAERHDVQDTEARLAELSKLSRSNVRTEPAYWQARANAERHLGTNAAAVDAYRRLRISYAEGGDTLAAARNLRNLADALLDEQSTDRARLEEARRLLDESREIATQIDSPRLQVAIDLSESRLALLRGDRAALAELRARILAATQLTGDTQTEEELHYDQLLETLRFAPASEAMSALEAEADRLLGAGEPAERRDLLEEAMTIFETRGELARRDKVRSMLAGEPRLAPER